MATDDLVLDSWNGIVEEVLDYSEFRAVRICGRVAGCLTLLGSSYIIQDILKDATRRKATKNRIVLFMSLCDLATSLVDSIPQNMWAPRNMGSRKCHNMCDIRLSAICELFSVCSIQCQFGFLLFAHSEI